MLRTSILVSEQDVISAMMVDTSSKWLEDTDWQFVALDAIFISFISVELQLLFIFNIFPVGLSPTVSIQIISDLEFCIMHIVCQLARSYQKGVLLNLK
jgi:hypothetical protein